MARNLMARKARTPQFPGDFARKLGGGAKGDMVAYYVGDACDLRTAKVQKVQVVRLRGCCDNYDTGFDYADLSDGRHVSTTFLFPVEGYMKPKLCTLRDGFGTFRQWVALPKGCSEVRKAAHGILPEDK